jgi:glutaminase
MQLLVDQLYARHKPLDGGEVAAYIPELSKANPDDFGVCLVTSDGRVFQAGDCDRLFTMQSISKPFTFGMAIDELGQEKVLQYVGVEPSGDAFNSIELQGGNNRPYNPMVNAGAITVALLQARHGTDALRHLLDSSADCQAGRWRSTRPCMSPSGGRATATGRLSTCS